MQGRENPVPVFYVDGHRKPVYADALIPRGLIGRTGKVPGMSRSGRVARSGRSSVVGHHRSGRPASDVGTASHAYP